MTLPVPHDLLNWCERERAWLLQLIETLVRCESPSGDAAAVNRCGDLLASFLDAMGGEVTRISGGGERGDHLRAEFSGAGPRLLLLGHFDTVWPVGQLDRMPLKVDGGRLYGPGVFDMKAGIGVAMLAMRALAALAVPVVPRVTMLWTTDEEVGSDTSRALIEETAHQCDAVLVLEPSLPGGAAKTSRKGCGDYALTVHGVAAHAGLDPGKGASAIHELAHQIRTILTFANPERGITLNVGLIDGGTRTNVVAETARASIDVRVETMADAQTIEEQFRRLRPLGRDIRLDVQGGVNRPPLERTPAVARLYLVAREVARELGEELEEGGAGGGSDGNFTAAAGVPTLDGLGPRGDGAHARHEHVEIDDLPWRAAFIAGLIARLGNVSR